MRRRSALLPALAALAAAAFGTVHGSATAAAAEPRHLLVVSSRAGDPYDQVIKGFREQLTRGDAGWAVDVQVLPEGDAKAVRLVADGHAPPALVFAVGAAAAKAVRHELPEVPLVEGLVLRRDVPEDAPHTAGVHLEFPLELQIEWIRRMLPAAKSVGVLYNPARNAAVIESAARLSAKSGLTLRAIPVPGPTDLPAALDGVGGVDALWSIPDDTVLTPQTARQILLFSFRNRIPVVGLSAAWVKAGALYALDWDFEDLGRQCAELAAPLVHGITSGTGPAGPASFAPPRKATYVVNAKTFRYMKLGLPDALLRGAREVFE